MSRRIFCGFLAATFLLSTIHFDQSVGQDARAGKKYTTSYSNAALSTVGYVLERAMNEPFPQLMHKKILEPLDMRDSSFDPGPYLRKRMAHALMWTYHGREFRAPTWDFGMGPAGSLYSTVDDLGKFLAFLFAAGKGPRGQLLKRETLEKMWQIQFAKKGTKAGFGLGFYVSEFAGRRRIGHGGAVYGFATELAALPDDKLGVVVVSSRDVANGASRRIAEVALQHMLAVRRGQPLPRIEETQPLDPEQARHLAGKYQAGKKHFELRESKGRLFFFPGQGGLRLELRRQGDALVVDDAMGYGQKFSPKEKAIQVGAEVYRRVADRRPDPAPKKWHGLIGEYGPDFNVLYILEKGGQLHALIEWVFLYPLREVSENVFKFPDHGLYMGDQLIFTRDGLGRATQVDAASVLFRRRCISGEGGTFTIRPVRPLEELRKAALDAQPPLEKNVLFRKPDLVEVIALDPTIKLDIRYASKNNFLGGQLYSTAKAFLQRPAAEAVVRAHKKLGEQGYGLLIHDGYRPWHVTKIFWDATEEKHKLFVADPQQGSRHNRGCAVDLTLFDRQTGAPVPMVSGYDEFSDRAYADYLAGTSLERWHRDLLRRAMEDEGFTVYPAEWWHYDFRDWRHYPVGNVPFEAVK